MLTQDLLKLALNNRALIFSVLSWSDHVDTVLKKAKNLGVVHRTLGPSNLGAFSILYKSLLRPI